MTADDDGDNALGGGVGVGIIRLYNVFPYLFSHSFLVFLSFFLIPFLFPFLSFFYLHILFLLGVGCVDFFFLNTR